MPIRTEQRYRAACDGCGIEASGSARTTRIGAINDVIGYGWTTDYFHGTTRSRIRVHCTECPALRPAGRTPCSADDCSNPAETGEDDGRCDLHAFQMPDERAERPTIEALARMANLQASQAQVAHTDEFLRRMEQINAIAAEPRIPMPEIPEHIVREFVQRQSRAFGVPEGVALTDTQMDHIRALMSPEARATFDRMRRNDTTQALAQLAEQMAAEASPARRARAAGRTQVI